MKIRTLEELDSALDSDLSWRKHEISLITNSVFKAKGKVKLTMKRAAITLMYSHWEGYVKKSSEIYLAYLNRLAPKYCNMKDNFSHISLKSRFNKGFTLKKYDSQKEIFDYIINGLNCNFNVNYEDVIDTESNLKSEQFSNILSQLGLDMQPFELKFNFIDQKLIKNRNAIAHGEYVADKDINDAYDEISTHLLELIDTFHSMIKSAASNKEYLKLNTEVTDQSGSLLQR
ncbi:MULTISPECIES: MAE_28990/MAE_18760 family HEPN-like nuclease [unclassified Providencia]|uniref:MAE_28990/MAE_18760 family HEPN-like nuclease n=1 Tax=unclassified Providencia TaxID=2633465 RepID=UPI002348F8E0|nr:MULTISPECIES: MAE_28990/MAE_18760 family HEPN-like nuclease [unclassified Providencia]